MAATQTPPAKKSSKPAAPQASADNRHWMERLSRSGYLLGAILVHLLIFLIVATWVVFQAPAPPPDDFNKTYVASAPAAPAAGDPSRDGDGEDVGGAAPTPIMSQNAAVTFSVPLPSLDTATPMDSQTKLKPLDAKPIDNLGKRMPASSRWR